MDKSSLLEALAQRTDGDELLWVMIGDPGDYPKYQTQLGKFRVVIQYNRGEYGTKTREALCSLVVYGADQNNRIGDHAQPVELPTCIDFENGDLWGSVTRQQNRSSRKRSPVELEQEQHAVGALSEALTTI